MQQIVKRLFPPHVWRGRHHRGDELFKSRMQCFAVVRQITVIIASRHRLGCQLLDIRHELIEGLSKPFRLLKIGGSILVKD
jgi:hypothetical protein